MEDGSAGFRDVHGFTHLRFIYSVQAIAGELSHFYSVSRNIALRLFWFIDLDITETPFQNYLLKKVGNNLEIGIDCFL